jgi:hypothetical protein
MANPYFFSQTQKDAISGSAAGLAANAAPSQQDYFVPGTFDGMQAAGKGAAAGSAAGPVGALAGAIFGTLGETIKQPFKINKSIRNVNTQFNSTSYDAYGRPVYVGGDVSRAASDIQGLNKTAEWDKDNILGLGRKASRKRDQVLQNMHQAQNQYNNADVSYRNSMNQQEDYYQRINSNSRLYNLFR